MDESDMVDELRMRLNGEKFDAERYESERYAIVKGYESLHRVLHEAMDQAAVGKGADRHADDESFESQQICEIDKRLEQSPCGFTLGQAVKKIYETTRLNREMAIAELNGAINYLAAAILHLERYEEGL